MEVQPTKPTKGADMEKRNFLFLFALNASNAKVGAAILEAIKRNVDSTAAPAWIDSRGVGVFISSSLTKQEIWKKSMPNLQTQAERETFRDALLLELGKAHLGFPETKGVAWLNSHATAEQPPT